MMDTSAGWTTSSFSRITMASKRGFDVVVSGGALIIMLPLFALIAVLVRFESPGEVFFRQDRVGLNGKGFKIIKFRTMRPDAEAIGGQLTLAEDPRVTRVGAWLRKFKLDELPQLLNVLRGEMSLVGPRPEVPKYVKLYTPEQLEVLRVRPGITCPASIMFYNESELLTNAVDPEDFYVNYVMPKKLALYAEYTANLSFRTDLSIIFRTARRTFSIRSGRHSRMHAGNGMDEATVLTRKP